MKISLEFLEERKYPEVIYGYKLARYIKSHINQESNKSI